MNADHKKPELSDLDQAALYFHKYPVPGKLEIQATKPLGNQRDLALAYSPGVAAPCLAIHDNPELAADYTGRANLVGVVSNGSAVLGLGNIGPLAAKPVMEGKAVLFKKFAGIDVFDIEIDAPGIERMVDTISALEPTFGGINLEDIKAPECFEVEEQLKARMGIPVFHDDQHGTAIIVAAAVLNGLELAGKTIGDVKIVTSGAGAAALACLNLLVELGARRENIWVTDRFGVAYHGRVDEMDRWKDPYVKDTDARTLADVIGGADIFLGLSAAGVLKPELLAGMAARPLILALANPVPEIMPEVARAARPDAMICTGRSDFPNQVNNVLCFPYIFRGALDCGARAINEDMKMAAVRAIAALAREEPSDIAARAYSGETPMFGPDFLIPSPFDPRLILRIAPAVARAACESGVAARPIEDWPAYVDRLTRFVFRSGLVMKPVFSSAKTAAAKRVIYADGEDERVLRAAQVVLEEGIAHPILIGRPHVIDVRLKRYGLRIRPGTDFTLINPEDDPRYRDYVDLLIELAGRRGVTQEAARTTVRTDTTVIAALGAETRRCRRHDLRPRGPLRKAPAQRQSDHRAAPGREGPRPVGAFHADLAARRDLLHRHLCDGRSVGRGDRRGDDARRRRDPPLRHRAESGAAVAFEFRLARFAECAEDARGGGDPEARRARADQRRRDARRFGAFGDPAQPRLSAFASEGRGELAGFSESRFGQHRHDDRQDDAGRAACRADPARHRQAGAHTDAVRHLARRRQHDGAGGGRSLAQGAGAVLPG